MAILYFLRHQAGLDHLHPFVSPPTPAQVEERCAALHAKHGAHHPKTGAHWVAVVRIDTDLPEDDPGHATTLGGHHDGKHLGAGEIHAVVSGHCPIRAGEVEPRLCPHGHNDLAVCNEGCATLLSRGFTRSDIELLAAAGAYEAALKSDKPAPVDGAQLRVGVSAVGTVTNPKG